MSHGVDTMSLIEILIPGEGIHYKQKASEMGRGRGFIESVLILRAARDIQVKITKTSGSGIWQRAHWKLGRKKKKSLVKFTQAAKYKKKAHDTMLSKNSRL